MRRQLEQALEKHGVNAEIWVWERPEDIEELMQLTLSADFDAILSCGGDGTLHHIAKPLIGTDIPVGIIPAGSGNAVCGHLKLPLSINQSIAMLNDYRIESIDTGTINGEPFVAFFGIGVDAEVIHVFGNTKRRSFGGYFWTAISKYSGYRPEKLQLDTGEKQVSCQPHLLGIINGSEYGNRAILAPNASMQDGKLDCFWVIGPPIWTAPEVVWRIFTGRLDRAKYYRRLRFEELTLVRSRSGHAQLDGEPFDTGEKLHIQVVPKSLKIMLPADHQHPI